jgi:hypothetical protein
LFQSSLEEARAKLNSYKETPFGLFSSILYLKEEKLVGENIVKTFLLQSNRNTDLSMKIMGIIVDKVMMMMMMMMMMISLR